MTPQQIEIVQRSFAQVSPIAPLAADLFYARLFELDPQLRGLFKTDMKRQGMSLMTMLSSAVRGLKSPEALVPVLKSLGRRHAVYGVQEAHYATVGQALLDTLKHALGDDFDDETRAAWAAAYALIASVMQIGAREMVDSAPANEGEAITKVHQLVA